MPANDKEIKIPDKAYFRIGEVAEITGIEPHVLRYWEKEFRQIRPQRVAGQRLYRQKDVHLIFRIKKLLYEEGFTISGARRKLTEEKKSPPKDLIREIRLELLELKRLLDKD
ncbi:MerR family transcriptional regulator [Thermosulfuriphilus sp.]